MWSHLSRRGLLLSSASALLAAGASACSTTDMPLFKDTLRFTAHSGSWMSVDVSPDGEAIVFDLLGALYEVSIEGGPARRLTEGAAWCRAPRYHPHGQDILCVRDGDGGNEIWLLSRATGDLRQITDHSSQPYGVVRGAPAWSRDGAHIVFSVDDDGYTHLLRTLEVSSRRIAIFSEATGLAQSAVFCTDDLLLTTRKLQSTAEELAVGMDYFRTALDVIDRRTGATRRISPPSVNDYCPQISRDGRLLAYIRQDVFGRISLRIQALGEPSSDKELCALPDDDDPLRFDTTDTRPGFSFTADGRALIIGAGGKLRRVDIETGREAIIEFAAEVDRPIARRVAMAEHLTDAPRAVRQIQWPQLSPDHGGVVFAALGNIWVQQFGHPARRLTTAGRETFEAMPALSADGSTVSYIAGEIGAQGFRASRLMIADLATGETRLLYQGAGCVYAPAWSGDGERVAFVIDDIEHSSFAWVNVQAPDPVRVLGAPRPSLSPWSRMVRFNTANDGLLCSWELSDGLPHGSECVEIDLRGKHRRAVAAAGRETQGMLPSPDGAQALVLGIDEDVWLLRGNDPGQRYQLGQPQLQRVTSTGARYAVWQNANTITFSLTNRLYRLRLGSDSEPEFIGEMNLPLSPVIAAQPLAFHNGRIITMNGAAGAGEVIDDGVLIVRGRRIVAVGARTSTPIPTEARRIDLAGATLMPGLFDTHYHPDMGGLANAYASWEAPASGITTVLIPSHAPWNEAVLAYEDLQEIARTPGPRWRVSRRGYASSNGDASTALFSSSEDASRHAAHRAELGATVQKEYLTRRRDHRIWLARAADAAGTNIIAHTCGIDEALTRAIDGYTGIEHVPFPLPIYDDVERLLAHTNTFWTPNFIATAWGTANGRTEPHDYRWTVLTRWPELEAKWRFFYGDFANVPSASPARRTRLSRIERAARACASLIEAGGLLSMSAHNPPACFLIAEMWYLQNGGVDAGAVLRTATINSAMKMGLDRDLGSLEVGKIADLLIVKDNPLEDVLNLSTLTHVVMNGVVREVSEMMAQQQGALAAPAQTIRWLGKSCECCGSSRKPILCS